MPPYFLGSIVLIKSESAPNSDVVDGQQRLTTLTLLLSAIRANVGDQTAKDITQLISWEIPRLCRGGSRSLTYPAVRAPAIRCH